MQCLSHKLAPNLKSVSIYMKLKFSAISSNVMMHMADYILDQFLKKCTQKPIKKEKIVPDFRKFCGIQCYKTFYLVTFSLSEGDP
jgi:hypothetical protein